MGLFCSERAVRRGLGEPGPYRIDPDAVFTEFVGRYLYQLVDRGLAGAVRRQITARKGGRRGRHRHERATTGADHGLTGVFQQQVDGTHVLVDFLAELIVAVEEDGDQRASAGHHDGDMQAPLLVRGGIHGGPHLIGHERVTGHPGHRESLVRQSGRGVTELLLGPPGQGDLRSVPGQQAGGPKADTTAATDHDGPFPTENLLHSTPDSAITRRARPPVSTEVGAKSSLRCTPGEPPSRPWGRGDYGRGPDLRREG